MKKTIKTNNRFWKLFTKEEEYNPVKLDKHKRFLFRFSKYKKIFDPEVSKFIKEKNIGISWPENKKFAVTLTHDVDNISSSWIYRGLTSLKLMSKFGFKRAGQTLFIEEKFQQELEELKKLEDRYRAKSSFYILATNKDVYYKRYDVKKLKNELSYLINNGFEVGLHGGYYSYLDINAIKKEKEKLEKTIGEKIIGYRNHFLRFKIPDTWILLNKAGFKYDTTFGYADMVGFRNGMCHPFKPFNLRDNKEINILEIPLTIMDTTLFKNMNLDFEKSWQVCKKLIDVVKNIGGNITILWHNLPFDPNYFEDWKKLYEKILDYCHKNNAWLTSGKEIWKWFNEKQEF